MQNIAGFQLILNKPNKGIEHFAQVANRKEEQTLLGRVKIAPK